MKAFSLAAGLGNEASDTSALTAALASGEKNLIVDPVQFQIEAGTYTIPEGTTLKGFGKASVLYCADPTLNVGFLSIGGDDVAVGNFVLRGPQDTVTTYLAGQRAITNPNDDEYHNVSLKGLEIYGWAESGIYVYRPWHWKIERNNIHDIGRNGVLLFGGGYSDVFHNIIKTMGPGSGGSPPMVQSYNLTFTNDHPDVVGLARAKGHRACFNYIADNPSYKGIDVHGGEQLLIQGNVVENTSFGIAIQPSTGSNNDYSDSCQVIGNRLTTTVAHSRCGISLAATNDTGTGWGDDFVIANNIVDGHGGSQTTYDINASWGAEGAIQVINSRNWIVQGNIVRRFHGAGIRIRQHSLAGVVSGNVIQDGTASNSKCYAIEVENGSNVEVLIDDNIMRKTNSPGTMNGVLVGVAGYTGNYGVRLGANNGMIGLDTNLEANVLTRIHPESAILDRYPPTLSLTIGGSGSVTIPSYWRYHGPILLTIDTFEAAATDDFLGIEGAQAGWVVVIKTTSASRQVIIKNNGVATTEFRTASGGDIVLDDVVKSASFMCVGSFWTQI